MAFENISKGEFVATGRSVRLHNAIMIESRSNRQAEFIAFCLNLQQRYDISKLEEVVKTLDEIKSMCDGNMTNENNIWHKCNNILKQIKK